MKVFDVATGSAVATLRGHKKPVIAAAFSPDGHRVATAGRDGTVKLWETATGKGTCSFDTGTQQISSLAYSADGWQLAALGRDGLVKLWDARPAGMSMTDYNIVRAEQDRGIAFQLAAGEFRASSSVRALAFSPDGQLLAVAAPDEPVRLVRAAGAFGKPAPIALQGATNNTVALVFSVDSKQLVTNQVHETSVVSLWDMATGQKTLALPLQPKAISSMALSRDGNQLATASLDQALRLWDAKSGEERRSLTPVTTVITSLAFSPDGKWLAAAGHDRAVRIWDVATGKVMRSFATDRYFITGVAFSPDGKQFASPALDGFKVWATDSWRESYFPLSQSATLRQSGLVAFTTDCKRLVTAINDGVRVWDVEAWREISARRTPPFPVFRQAVGLSHDGNYAATAEGNGSVRLWYLSALAVPGPAPEATGR